MPLLPALFFGVAGLAHFIRPRLYVDIMPPWIPRPLAWVYFTGVCEIVGGAGLLHPGTRTAAAWGLIALLVCVFPANIHMFRASLPHGWTPKTAALAARLPLQFLLIYWVYASAGLG